VEDAAGMAGGCSIISGESGNVGAQVIIPPWVKLAAVAVVAALIFSAGFRVATWKAQAEIKQAQDAAEVARVAKAEIAAKLVSAQSQTEAKIVERTKVVYRTISSISGPAKCLDQVPNFREVWNGQ